MEDNTYLLGKMVTAEAELARLVDQSRVIGEVIGDLFPPSVDVDPSLFRRVLDIGSGSGDWCLEVAQALPNSEVCGIDLTPYMVNYARAQAECRGLQVEFQVMNALERLKFSDGTFDLINMRFGASFVLNSLWASLFQEVKRLLRPGGVFVCTEIDLGVTNSAAWGQMLQWIAGVGHVRNIFAGKGFSVGTVAMLGKHFQDAHFAPIEYYPYFWDASVGSVYHESWIHNALATAYQIKPMVVHQLQVSEERFDAVLQQAQEEWGQEDFRMVAFLLSVVGTKPS